MHQVCDGRVPARCPNRLELAHVVGTLLSKTNIAHQSGLGHITGQGTEGDMMLSTLLGGQGTSKQLC